MNISEMAQKRYQRFRLCIHTNASNIFEETNSQQTFSEKFYFKRVLHLNTVFHYNILQNIIISYRFIAKTVQDQYKIL